MLNEITAAIADAERVEQTMGRLAFSPRCENTAPLLRAVDHLTAGIIGLKAIAFDLARQPEAKP